MVRRSIVTVMSQSGSCESKERSETSETSESRWSIEKGSGLKVLKEKRRCTEAGDEKSSFHSLLLQLMLPFVAKQAMNEQVAGGGGKWITKHSHQVCCSCLRSPVDLFLPSASCLPQEIEKIKNLPMIGVYFFSGTMFSRCFVPKNGRNNWWSDCCCP